MNIGKIAAACLAAGLVVSLPAEESRPAAGVNELSAANQDAILDTIAQINHINWVVNVIKSYNNVIVLEEEYEKISPGNLYLDRIPDEETLGRITKMLDTLYSLRKDDRQMKKWRMDFRESRDRKIRDHKHKATKEAVDTITGQVKECCSLWNWATNPLGSIANVVDTAFNMAHYSVGLHNDYDNFVYELDKTAKDRQFDFDGEKLDLLHNQNKEILQDQWQFIRRYNLDDRLRVSDVDIRMLLNCLKNDNPAWIFTRLYPMRERFSLFPEYWYYLSCAAMETGHFKEGLEACDTFFKVNRGLFRDDPMAGTVAFNKAFMLPKTKENKPEVRRCLELAWTKNANVTHPDWQLDYLAAIMYKGVFDEKEKAEMMLEHAIALIEQESRERTRYGSKAGVTLDEGLRNCRNALHQLRGEPIEAEEKTEEKPHEESNEKIIYDDEIVASLVASQINTAQTGLTLYDDGIRVIVPYDKHLLSFEKFNLKLERDGQTVKTLAAYTGSDPELKSRVSEDGTILVLVFLTDAKQLGMDTFRMVYNDSKCRVEWVVHPALKYIRDSEIYNLASVGAREYFESSPNPKTRRLIFAIGGEGESTVRQSYIASIKNSLSKIGLFHSFIVKGSVYRYEHKVSDGNRSYTLDSSEFNQGFLKDYEEGFLGAIRNQWQKK